MKLDHVKLTQAAGPQDWEALYRETADEDRALAEAGLGDYATILTQEVMLDAWCELPGPPPDRTSRSTVRRTPAL